MTNLAIDIQKLDDRYDRLYKISPTFDSTEYVSYDYSISATLKALDDLFNDDNDGTFDDLQYEYGILCPTCKSTASELQGWIDSNQAAYNTATAAWTTADSQITSQGTAFDRIKEQTFKPDIINFYQFTNAA